MSLATAAPLPADASVLCAESVAAAFTATVVAGASAAGPSSATPASCCCRGCCSPAAAAAAAVAVAVVACCGSAAATCSCPASMQRVRKARSPRMRRSTLSRLSMRGFSLCRRVKGRADRQTDRGGDREPPKLAQGTERHKRKPQEDRTEEGSEASAKGEQRAVSGRKISRRRSNVHRDDGLKG